MARVSNKVRNKISSSFRSARQQINQASRQLQKQKDAAKNQARALAKEEQRLFSQQSLRQIRSPADIIARNQQLAQTQQAAQSVAVFQSQLQGVQREISQAEREINSAESQALQDASRPTKTTFTLPSGEKAVFTGGSKEGTIFSPGGVAVGTTTRDQFTGANRSFTGGQSFAGSTPFGEGVDVPGFTPVGTTPSGGVLVAESRTLAPQSVAFDPASVRTSALQSPASPQDLREQTTIQRAIEDVSQPAEAVRIQQAGTRFRTLVASGLTEEAAKQITAQETGVFVDAATLQRIQEREEERLLEEEPTGAFGGTRQLFFRAVEDIQDQPGSGLFIGVARTLPIAGSAILEAGQLPFTEEQVARGQRRFGNIPGVPFIRQIGQAPVSDIQSFEITAGLGLAPSVFGGSTASAQRALLAQDITAAQTRFLGEIAGDSVKIGAGTTVRDIPIETLIRGQFVRNADNTIIGFRGGSGTLVPLTETDTLAIARQLQSKILQRGGGARDVRDIVPGFARQENELKDVITNINLASSREVGRGIFRQPGLIDEPTLIAASGEVQSLGRMIGRELEPGQIVQEDILGGIAQRTQITPDVFPETEFLRQASVAKPVKDLPPQLLEEGFDFIKGIPREAQILKARNVQGEVVGIVSGTPRRFLVKSKGIVTEFTPDTSGLVKVIRSDDLVGGLDDLARSGGIKTGAEGGTGRQITTQQLKQEFPAAAVDLAVKQAALDTFTPAIQRLSSQIGRGTTISRQVQIPFGGLQQASSAPVISTSNVFAGQQQAGQQARQQFITDFQGIQLTRPTQQEIEAVVNTRVPKVTGLGLTFDRPKVGQITVTRPGQVEAIIPSLTQSQQNRLRTALLNRAGQRTDVTTVTTPREAIGEIPGTPTRVTTITDTPQRQRLGTPQVPRVPEINIAIPTIPKAPGLPPPGKTFTDTKEKLDKLKGKAVNVVVGKGDRKKVVFRNLPPNRAMKKGLEHIKRTIRASFVLKPTGKVTKKKDIKFTRPNTQQFRPGRTNALRVVERKNLRLNTPKEKVQLADSRRRADRRRKNRGGLFGI